MVPANHRVDGFCEFGTARFVDATRVYLKVLLAVAAGLFSAETDFVIAILALSSTVYQISKVDLLCIRSP